jgi:hypothetical protein
MSIAGMQTCKICYLTKREKVDRIAQDHRLWSGGPYFYLKEVCLEADSVSARDRPAAL